MLMICFLFSAKQPSESRSSSRTTTPEPIDDFSEEELNDLIALNRFNQIPELPKSTTPEEIRPQTSRPKPPPRSRQQIKCFSCGSLLNAENNCTQFNPSDVNQVQTCGLNEACLLYTWKKSPTETAVLRECFPKSVVLGPIDNPLRPTPDCNLRDVSEPDAGISGSACLCETSFCNNKQELQTITAPKTPTIINEVEPEEGPICKFS